MSRLTLNLKSDDLIETSIINQQKSDYMSAFLMTL